MISLKAKKIMNDVGSRYLVWEKIEQVRGMVIPMLGTREWTEAQRAEHCSRVRHEGGVELGSTRIYWDPEV